MVVTYARLVTTDSPRRAVSGQLSSNPLAQPPEPDQPARALLYKRRRVKCHIYVLYCISMTGLSMHSHIARIRNRISCSMSDRRRRSQLEYIQRVSLRRVLWPVYYCTLEAFANPSFSMRIPQVRRISFRKKYSNGLD